MLSEERTVDYRSAGVGEIFGRANRRSHERAFDLCLLVLMLPLLAIPLAVIAGAVFLDSSGGVLYRTRRVGAGGRPFWMLKFRTMRHGSTGPSLTAAADARITPLGRFLRNSRLDELPQLWNVLRGEMRLVGPRPELEEFVAMFPVEYEEILEVPPGIAGRTQLEFALVESALLDDGEESGRLYAERLMPRKVACDLEYVRSRSISEDLRILGATLLLPARALWSRLWNGWSALTGATRKVVLATCAAAVALMLLFLGSSGPTR